MKCVKWKGNQKCEACESRNVLCVPHKSRQGYRSDIAKKQKTSETHDKGEQRVWSLPNIVAPSELLDLLRTFQILSLMFLVNIKMHSVRVMMNH